MYKFIHCYKRIWIGLFAGALSLTVLLFISIGHAAAEDMKLQLKISDYGVSTDLKRLPDDRRHLLALSHRQGNAETDDGEKAEYEAYSIIDAWVGVKGYRKGYSVLTFADGSRIFYSWTADSKRNSDNLPSLKGAGEVTRGAGKFEGIKGKVEFSGVQDKATSEDPRRTRTTNLVLVYTLP